MQRLATVFGGSGFIGRYVVTNLARAGWLVRVAVRRPDEALFLKTAGVVGQVTPVAANVRDRASVARAVAGADAVVNLVGILHEGGPQKFEAVQAEGAKAIAEEAARAGARQLVQISAIGADAKSNSAYARTKAAGEAAVRQAFPTPRSCARRSCSGRRTASSTASPDGAAGAGAAADRRRQDPVPAGLCRRRRRGGGEGDRNAGGRGPDL